MTEEQVFLAVLELPDQASRTDYLNEACGGNSDLRRSVEELLAAHERSGSFLDTPAAEQMAAGPQIPGGQTLALDAEGGSAMADNKKNVPSSADDGADDLHFLSPSTRPDALGRLGHYEMLQVLGRGGFGIVFRAFDDTLQRVVAVKVMAPQIATLSPARKRFLREAQSSAKVRHENVVQIYEVGEQPLPYLAMEFIPGETLQQKLDRSGPLDVPEILRIGRQIAEGLAAAHACDLIHRDIKPGNVLLEGGSHKAKITDFGLARAADDASISQSGIIAGTPMFMAPEQALGHKIDQRADLFSLGSVLYQMASGRPPFRAPSALAVLKRVAEESPRPIPEIIPETPDWLCGIIAKLHAKNPDDRFQSAREVADLLADCEAKLKAKQELKNILPAAVKPAAPTGRRWIVAAAVLLLPVLALAVTESAGVTHLFRGQPADTKVADVGGKEPDPKKSPEEKKVPPQAGDSDRRAAQSPAAHDNWIKAVALLPLEQHAAAVPAKLKERLHGFEDALLRTIPSMAGDRQAIMVAAWLRDRNPAFDGEITHKIEGGVLTSLEVPSPIVRDLTPLRALPGLRSLTGRSTLGYDNLATRDTALLQSLKALETINGKPVAQFWKDTEARQTEFQEWLQLVPTLSAPQQVAAVVARLKERNPGLDGTARHKIEGRVVTELTFVPVKGQDFVADLSPMRALAGLTALELWGCLGLEDLAPLKGMKLTRLIIGSLTVNNQVRDLEPLKGMKLTELYLHHCQVQDLEPLKDMPLTKMRLFSRQITDLGPLKDLPLITLGLANCSRIQDFWPLKDLPLTELQLNYCKVRDLEPFKGMKLTGLYLASTPVLDLQPIKGMPLKHLSIQKTGVTDLRPLQGMELEEIFLTPKNITQGLDIVRDMKSVKKIGIEYNPSWEPKEFWERYDKGQFAALPSQHGH